jgi:hypothetical protein
MLPQPLAAAPGRDDVGGYEYLVFEEKKFAPDCCEVPVLHTL